MADTVLILWTHVVIMITAALGLAASVIGLAVSRSNSKGLQDIKVTLNGNLDRIIALEREMAHAEGYKAGKEAGDKAR